MKQFISWTITIAIFIGWMLLVGSPSTTETLLGLVIAGGFGLWVCSSLKCLNIEE